MAYEVATDQKLFLRIPFVRLAKAIAIGIAIIGVLTLLFRYVQASNSAASVAYRPSVGLDQRLDRLSTSLVRTVSLVSAFNSAADSKKIQAPRFERSIRTDSGFARLGEQLGSIDGQRTSMKQLVVDRFESSVAKIEQRLRAHAASLRAAATPSASTAPAGSPVATATATPAPSLQEEQETLFSKRVANYEISNRLSALEKAKLFLSELEAKAENLESRKSLFDSVTELEGLKKLLPTRAQPAPLASPSSPSATSSSPEPVRATEARTPAKAEEVADQLVAFRRSVRESMLTSWALDEAFDEASEFAGAEANKCTAASLIVKGIWLSAMGQMALAAVAAALVAFLILVMADLTQTFLDTATNTAVLAQASKVGTNS